MKKFILIFLNLIWVFSAIAQEEEKHTNENKLLLSIEVLKPIKWLLKKGCSYVIEPEITYQRNRFLYNLSLGYNYIATTIYKELAYKNTGVYIKAGAGIELDYNKKSRFNLTTGLNLIFSSYNETFTSSFGGLYFDVYDHILEQKNSSAGVEFFFTHMQFISDKIFISMTPKISYVANSYDQEFFAVYYAPGFGSVNIFGNISSEKANHLTAGLSVRIGYRIK